MKEEIAALLAKYPGEFDNLADVELEESDVVLAIAYEPNDNRVLYNLSYMTPELREGGLAFISILIGTGCSTGIEKMTEQQRQWSNIAAHIYTVDRLSEIGKFVFSDDMLPVSITGYEGKSFEEVYELVAEPEYKLPSEGECDEGD